MGPVQNGDIRAHAHGHLRRVAAHDAAADDDDLGGGHAGHAAQKHAASALRLFQRMGPGLHGHPSGDLAHRAQQGQAAAGGGDGFIGDAGRAAVDQVAGLVGIGGKVQVGIKRLTSAQALALDGLGFLDLHHDVGAGEQRLDVGQAGPGGGIGLVRGTDAFAGSGLDQDLMAVGHQFRHAFRGQADAIFVVLDFLGAADDHRILLGLAGFLAPMGSRDPCNFLVKLRLP